MRYPIKKIRLKNSIYTSRGVYQAGKEYGFLPNEADDLIADGYAVEVVPSKKTVRKKKLSKKNTGKRDESGKAEA
jgi:hypothetical protein